MLFGFIVAAVAGFLLTAVPSWTGERGFAGWPVVLLATLWGLARLMIATSQLWPLPWVAGIDLLFIPGLTAFVVPPLVRSSNRNTPLLAVLLALWGSDLGFYWYLGHGEAGLARQALFVGIDIVMLLVTVIGGRIIPAFTSAALKHRGVSSQVRAWPGMTALAIVSMLAVGLSDLWRPDSRAAGVVAAVAAVTQMVRLAQWRGTLTLRMPIVWVLHFGYLWLPVGLALKGLFLLGGFGFASFYLHALTIGAATTMVVAVMTRASLGHTGRPLVVSRTTAYAYGLLSGAAVVRVFGPSFLPISYTWIVVVAAALWTAAFALFLAVYAPILLSPRANGKPS